MSAYIESKGHIDALVTLAGWGPEDRVIKYAGNGWTTIHYGNPTRSVRADGGAEASALGQLLIDENIKSVRYRYRGEAIDTLPGPIDKSDLLEYQYAPGRALTAVQGLMALDGYEYQTCEHPDWPASDAHSFCEALRSALISSLPGYNEAGTWSID